MAKIYAMPNAAEWEQKKGEDFSAWMKREQAMFEELREKSEALPLGELKGFMVSTPRGDGAAHYIVHSVKPLALLHVPFCDKWRDPYMERTINLTELKRMQKQDKAFSEMFNKRAA